MRISDGSTDVCSSDLWTGLHPRLSHELHGSDGDKALREVAIYICGVRVCAPATAGIVASNIHRTAGNSQLCLWQAPRVDTAPSACPPIWVRSRPYSKASEATFAAGSHAKQRIS